MATTKTDMLANIARSMQGRPDVSPGNRPDVSPGNPSSLSRRSQGYRRLESAAVIALDRIVADPNQPRTEFDPESMERLAASLRERGQLQPIRVRWDDAADRYVVVVGERRWRAARRAGLESLACVVVTGEPAAEDILEDQLVENALRDDLKPVEQARAYQSLMKSRNLSTRELAQRLRIAAGSVTKALALLNLPAEIQEDVDAGKIAAGTAYELSKVEDAGQLVTLAEEAKAGRLKRDDLTGRTRRPRGGKPRPWVWRTERVQITVAPLTGDVSEEELTEALKSALAERKKQGGRAA
jgi:ParB family chromosome partitioning protein